MATIVAAILHEMAQIATLRGIALQDIALFPTKTLSQLAWTTPSHTAAYRRPMGVAVPTNKVSALQEVEQGKRLEVEETLGYAVRQGAGLGIPPRRWTRVTT